MNPGSPCPRTNSPPLGLTPTLMMSSPIDVAGRRISLRPNRVNQRALGGLTWAAAGPATWAGRMSQWRLASGRRGDALGWKALIQDPPL